MSTRQGTDRRLESVRIGPDDPRYLAVVDRRFNKRFRASPDYVRLVSSTDQVVAAVGEAVREGRRLAVRAEACRSRVRGAMGAFINHPHTDLADPALNTSAVPWYTLYYKRTTRPAADQGAVGPAECVPACVVHSDGMTFPLGAGSNA
jgi:hypothetical protein